jgi:hypothetical protein
MPLDEEYPKTFRKALPRFRELLARDAALPAEQREDLARALSDMADKAHDLDDIATRLLEEPHPSSEIGELLIAFELTTEQLRGHSDTIDGKLYEIGDRLKGETPADTSVMPTTTNMPTTTKRKETPVETAYEMCLRLLREEGGNTRQEQLANEEYAVWNLQNPNPWPKGKIGTFYPRKEGRWKCDIHLKHEDVPVVRNWLEEAGLKPNRGGPYFVSATLHADDVRQHDLLIRKILRKALDYSATN